MNQPSSRHNNIPPSQTSIVCLPHVVSGCVSPVAGCQTAVRAIQQLVEQDAKCIVIIVLNYATCTVPVR